MPRIQSITTRHVDIPQKVVFQTAQSRIEVAHALVVSIEADNGMVGFGEGTAVEYVTGETRDTVERDVASTAQALTGWDAGCWRAFCQEVRSVLPERPTACAVLEMAMVDLFCKTHGLSMHTFFGGVLQRVITDLTIPIGPPDQTFQLATEAAKTYSCLKIKVHGKDLAQDVEQVHQVHLAAPGAKLRIDANQGFTATEAVTFVRGLNRIGIVPQLVEQPVPKNDLAGLRYVKDHIDEPVIADESAVDPASVLRLLRAEAVDGINIKLMKSGITGALDIIALARAAGVKLMIGCMLETPIGIGAAVHLACGTGAFDFLDLDADVLGHPTDIPQNYTRVGETLSV